MGICRCRRYSAVLTILIILALLGGAGPSPEALAQKQVRVYVLRGGDAPSDQAVIQTLQARGFVVDRGVATTAFDGSQAQLTDYDVVVVLLTSDWNAPARPAGLAAIRAYVEGGGGLVVGEWFGWRGQLGALMPTVNCGWNTATETTYTQVTPHPTVNAGLPANFSFALGNFNGSEACMRARSEATVLYRSSNAGGKSDANDGVGLAVWNVGAGSVAAFSTLLSSTELQSTAYSTLLQNVVALVANSRDARPPVVRSFEVAGAGGLVNNRDVAVSVVVNDSGGSGPGAVLLVEYAFSGDPANAWRLVRTSGWQRYTRPRLDFTWTLSETPGVRYLQVFASDRAGNLSREPVTALISYQPAGPTSIATDEIRLFLVRPQAGQQATVRLDVQSGAPDLYVGGPSIDFAPERGQSEQVSFATEDSVYQIRVEGFQSGSYALSYQLNERGRPVNNTPAGPRLDRRGRGSIINLFPPEPVTNPGDLPAPPLDEEPAFLDIELYLPLLQR